jgi:hypothetical protein
MQITNAAQASEVSAARTAKGKVRTLLSGTENSPDNYVLRYSTGEEGEQWTTPRHRHPFDQVRYVLDGEYSIGTDTVLPAGWVGYFPESVYYGPQEMSPNLAMVVLQSGGPSGLGFYSADQRVRATAELKVGGSFDNGLYSWVDDAGRPHRKPAGDVVWEKVFGPSQLPPSRYDGIILMNPASFGWIDDTEHTGVSYKRLGTFTERDLRIGFIRLAAGASWRLGTQDAPEVLIVTSGRVVVDGAAHERLTAFGTAAAEAPQRIEASTPAEFFYVKLPTF